MLNRGQGAVFPAELLLWLSPSFPVGSFAYSHGLENEVAVGRVNDAATLTDWLMTMTAHGSLRNDMILLSLAYRSESIDELRQIAELASAMQPSAERAQESMIQGGNFRAAYLEGWKPDFGSGFDGLADNGTVTMPVCVAVAARDFDIPLLPAIEAYAIGFHGNLVSAAIRLGVIGQFDGQRILASLLLGIRETAKLAEYATEDDLGGAAFAVDMASMKHETQRVRLFRS